MRGIEKSASHSGSPASRLIANYHKLSHAPHAMLNVWHHPQGTKKSKKRNLVASGTHRLGKLLKEQEHELSTN